MRKEKTPAQAVVEDVCRIKKNERVLIIANPETNQVAQDLYTAVSAAGAVPALVFQPPRTSFDNALPEVLAAIATEPDVCFSISSVKLGKDPAGGARPYIAADGEKYTHIFDYLLYGKKTMRAVWTPGITADMMERTAVIDYDELARRCRRLSAKFRNAVSVHVTAPGGTDVTVPVSGRELLFDDGDFSVPGQGGNIPAGEVFISPVVGKGDGKGTQGVIVYDGSMTFSDGDSILESPIVCRVEDGFVAEISGGQEAKRLLRTITEAENLSAAMEKDGKLPAGEGEIYRRNARNIGELGIGLNPAARITGNMLEDEKAFHTCHFAVGENYDNDAPSLIHLDGVVREPTIDVIYGDGQSQRILDSGTLV